MEKEQRIWNLEELQNMSEVKTYGDGDWHHKDHSIWIDSSMVGKTVKWCKENYAKIGDWMIATTEEKKESIIGKGNSIGNFVDTKENRTYILSESTVENNSFTIYNDKTYIENPQSKTITLNNGTVIEVGKKYVVSSIGNPFEVIKIGNSMYAFWFSEIERSGHSPIDLDEKIIPYIEQSKEEPKEWKTFLIEKRNINDEYSYQVISRFMSEEDARTEYPRAKITEVKINIEEVNN